MNFQKIGKVSALNKAIKEDEKENNKSHFRKTSELTAILAPGMSSSFFCFNNLAI